MTHYVAGFMFDLGGVALVVKNRPAWMAGKYNAIGGHIEEGELPIQAMVREFAEETSIQTDEADWKLFCILTGETAFGAYTVHFFCTDGVTDGIKTTTDEKIYVVPLEGVTRENAIPNLSWLIPAASLALCEKSPVLYTQEVWS